MPDNPPRGLAWTITLAGRAFSYVLAALALAVSTYVGYLHIGLAECLNSRDLADRQRTSAISKATDVERAADLALLRATDEGRPAARAAALAAREATDAVRAAHPAPDLRPCR